MHTQRHTISSRLIIVFGLLLLLVGTRPAGAETIIYSYDYMGRLTSTHNYAGGTVWGYDYDGIGNRESSQIEATIPCATDHSVCNGDFEQDLDYWTPYMATAAIVPGRNSPKAADVSGYLIYQNLPGIFQGGTTYRATAWCKADIGDECRISFGDSGGGSNHDNVVNKHFPGTGEWQQISVVHTFTHDEPLVAVCLYAKHDDPDTHTLYDDGQVQEVSVAGYLLWTKDGSAELWMLNALGEVVGVQRIAGPE